MANNSLSKADPTRRCLPPNLWPAGDRLVWEEAIRPVDLLEEGGAAAEWAAATRRGVEHAYGRWIAWLTHVDPAALKLAPADRATREMIVGYITHLRTQVASVTVVTYIRDLRCALEVVASQTDWRWLRRLVSRVKLTAQPSRNKRRRIVPIQAFYACGERLMLAAEAPSTTATTVERACQYRNGLMIALLAVRPVRLSNLAMIEIGHHLLQHGAGYNLSFQPAETKTGTDLLTNIPFPAALLPNLDHYLTHHRPILIARQTANHPGQAATHHLWVSRRGTPLSESAIYGAFVRLTEIEFGHAINPHMFRDCAATTIATADPEHVGIIRSILGHSTLKTAEDSYIQANGLEASRRHQGGILALRQP